MAREVFVEQKKILRLGCYKEQKFGPQPGDPLDVRAMKSAKAACDFGFQDITPLCKNCVWFQIIEVSVNGRPAVADEVLERSEVNQRALAYRAQDTADPEFAKLIAMEKAKTMKKETD
jgi:hypothetical protein